MSDKVKIFCYSISSSAKKGIWNRGKHKERTSTWKKWKDVHHHKHEVFSVPWIYLNVIFVLMTYIIFYFYLEVRQKFGSLPTSCWVWGWCCIFPRTQLQLHQRYFSTQLMLKFRIEAGGVVERTWDWISGKWALLLTSCENLHASRSILASVPQPVK